MTGLTLTAVVFALAAIAAWHRARLFTARASHEVRGPLTVALLALDGMVARGEVRHEAARGLELQLHRARHGLDDLMVAPRGAHAPDRLEPVAVTGLLAQVALAWRPVAAARGVQLRVEPAPVAVLADRARLAQAIGNLVGNALEHGSGSVEIRARAHGTRLCLEVHDAGPGLRAPLAALSRRPRGTRGTRGHGLAIVASIAERHGGRLVAAPSATGATVAIELPLHDVAALEGAIE